MIRQWFRILIVLCVCAGAAGAANPTVRFELWLRDYYDALAPRTPMGDLNPYSDGDYIDVELFPDVAPGTVSNFLTYVDNDDYQKVLLHRFAVNFVVQGGGWAANPDYDPNVSGSYLYQAVANYGTIENEYSLPNTTGTIAMAKGAAITDPNTGEVITPARDTASNQWFFNLKDNTTILDPEDNFDPNNPNPNHHGGYTVFGETTAETLSVLLSMSTNYDNGNIGPQDGTWDGDFWPIFRDPVTNDFYTLEVDVYRLPAGDANGDYVTDDADYTLWADNYGLTGATRSQGDFNGDGTVDDADYTIWADDYGTNTAATPEPATMALLAIGAGGLLRRRR